MTGRWGKRDDGMGLVSGFRVSWVDEGRKKARKGDRKKRKKVNGYAAYVLRNSNNVGLVVRYGFSLASLVCGRFNVVGRKIYMYT